MKRYIFILFISVSLVSIKANGQTQDTTLNQLLAINKSNYHNRPLDSIIAVLPTGYTKMKIYGIRNTARMLLVGYPNKVWIELHVRQFNYMNPVDPNNVWNIAQMRLENLHSVTVYKGVNCYEGCPNY